MAKRGIYNSNLISSHTSYRIPDVCRLYKEQKLNDKTVRRWIKNSKLEAFQSDKEEFYVYG